MNADTGNYIWQAFNAINTPQGLIIAALIALITPRFALIALTAGVALIIDQFVTIAYDKIFNKSAEKILEKAIDKVLSTDATVLILRYVGFFVVIAAIYFVKSLVFRKK